MMNRRYWRHPPVCGPHRCIGIRHLNISFEAKCTIVAAALAVITAAIVVYCARVRRERVDAETVRWAGILLMMTSLALIAILFDIPVPKDLDWVIRLVVFGFAALFVWLVTPKKQ